MFAALFIGKALKYLIVAAVASRGAQAVARIRHVEDADRRTNSEAVVPAMHTLSHVVVQDSVVVRAMTRVGDSWQERSAGDAARSRETTAPTRSR